MQFAKDVPSAIMESCIDRGVESDNEMTANNSMQRTALCAAADAERYAVKDDKQ